jgi:hypothetical protein
MLEDILILLNYYNKKNDPQKENIRTDIKKLIQECTP